MAEIIKAGRKPDEVAYDFHCTRCDSIIRFRQSDRQSDQRDGDYAECPFCKHFIDWAVIVRDGTALR